MRPLLHHLLASSLPAVQPSDGTAAPSSSSRPTDCCVCVARTDCREGEAPA